MRAHRWLTVEQNGGRGAPERALEIDVTWDEFHILLDDAAAGRAGRQALTPVSRILETCKRLFTPEEAKLVDDYCAERKAKVPLFRPVKELSGG